MITISFEKLRNNFFEKILNENLNSILIPNYNNTFFPFCKALFIAKFDIFTYLLQFIVINFTYKIYYTFYKVTNRGEQQGYQLLL